MVLPKKIDHCSLTSLQQRLVNTGGRSVKHARYYWLLLAEGSDAAGVRAILRRIWALPLPAGKSWRLAGTKEWRRKEGGMVQLSENCAEMRTSFGWLHPGRGGMVLSCVLVRFRRCAADNSVAIEATCDILPMPNRKSRFIRETGN